MKTKFIANIRTIAFSTLTFAIILGSVSFLKSEEINDTDQKCKICSVPYAEVISYLEGYGYSNIVLVPVEGTCNVLASTDYEYDTMVYCTSIRIIGHEDVPTNVVE